MPAATAEANSASEPKPSSEKLEISNLPAPPVRPPVQPLPNGRYPQQQPYATNYPFPSRTKPFWPQQQQQPQSLPYSRDGPFITGQAPGAQGGFSTLPAPLYPQQQNQFPPNTRPFPVSPYQQVSQVIQ